MASEFDAFAAKHGYAVSPSKSQKSGTFREFAAKHGYMAAPSQPQTDGASITFDQWVAQKKAKSAQEIIQNAEQSLENGSISLDEFKRTAEGYRSYFGDETVDSIIRDAGAYGDQLSRNIFKAAAAHYVPSEQFDTGAYKPENAVPVIEERKRDHKQESGEQAALGSYLTVYDGASGKNGGLYDAAKADKAKKELEQYILDTYKLPKDQGIDLVEWARQKYNSLDAIATADLKKRHELEHGMSLQKEYAAYENLSDEDKQTVAEMLRIEAGGEKAKYDRLVGNSGSWYSNSMVHMNEGTGDGPGYNAWKKYKDLEQQLKDGGVLTPEVKAFIDRADNYLKTNIETEEWRKRTQDNSIPSNIASVLGKPGAAVQTAINTMGTNISNAVSGDNKPVDVYAPENLGSNVVNTIRSTSSEMILGDDPDGWKKLADKGYQLLMSTADSALTIPMSFIPTVGPGLAAGMMGIEAGADTALDAAKRGGAAGQALAAGICAGAAETLFEKYSIGELIKTAKASPKGIKGLLKSTLVNMGVNASEEAATEISNIITDTLIMQDLSNYNLTVAQHMSEGLSREEAENKAKLGLLAQVGEAALGGAIQGGFMSGVGNTAGYVRGAAQTRAAGDTVLHTAGGADALLAEAGRFPDNAAVQKAAEKVRQKGTHASMGNLAYELQQQTGRSMGNIINAYNKNAAQARIPAQGAGEAVSNAARFAQADTFSVGLVYDEYAANALNSGVANRLNTVAQMLGKRVRFADSLRGGTANAQISGNEILIEKNNPNPVQFLLGHELTHGIQQDAPAEYQAFRDCIAEDVQEEAQALQRVYQAQGVNIDYNAALDEATANYAGRLIEDTNVLDRFIQRNREKRGVLQRVRDAIRKLLQKLTGAERRMAQTAEGRLAAALDAAARQAGALEVNQNANQEAVAKYSIDPDFARVYDAWDKRQTGIRIRIGSTSNALQSIGVNVKDIYWDTGKIKKIKEKHPQMTDRVIKQVPNILENPILIMESQTVPGRLTLFGEVYDAAGVPVLAVLELNPTDKNGHSLDIIKIASAYGKNVNPQGLIDKSRILYVDPNKNRTDSWLTVNRLKLPAPSSNYGSIDTITPGNTGVNSQSMQEERKYSVPDETRQETLDMLYEAVQRGEVDKEAFNQAVQRAYDSSIEKNGAIQAGERPVRDLPYSDMRVPLSVSEGQKIRKFSRTAIEDGRLTEDMVTDMQRALVSGKFSYTPVSDSSAAQYAKNAIERGNAESLWQEGVAGGSISKNTMAIGEHLLVLAAERKDAVAVTKLIAEIAEAGTRAGQTVQAARMLKRIGPAGQLYYLQRAVNAMNRELEKSHKHFGKAKTPYVEIRADAADMLLRAKTQEDFTVAQDAILDDIASQIPPRFSEVWNAWRYLSMLGNPRTHIRNVLGNAAFWVTVRTKDAAAFAGERLISQDQRSKSLRVKPEYRDFAKQDYQQMEALITGESANLTQDIMNRRKLLPGFLEGFRKLNSLALEAEDVWFLRSHYTHALGGFLQARKADLSNIDSQTLEQARTYAINEAQKATFRDASAAAQAFQRLSRTSPVFSMAVEGNLPFKKTPINILKRGIEYSPIGLIKSLTKGVYDVRKGNISASQFIDGLASGLTGVGLTIAGALLASVGIAIGGFGKGKDDELRRLNGEQEYSLQIGDLSYTIDWLSPSAMPFFVGVEMYNAWQDRENLSLSNFINSISTITEPMLNMSMLDGLNSTLRSVAYSDTPLEAIAANSLYSYISQGIPTLSGQLARTIDGTRRTTYDDKNIDNPFQAALQKTARKIPGLSMLTPEFVDKFGNTETGGNAFSRALENFISPGFTSKVTSDPVNDELYRLGNQTGDWSVVPGKTAKYITIDGVRKDLTQKEYKKYAEVRGQTAQKALQDVVDSSGYQSMKDEEKAKLTRAIYDYAGELAKASVSNYQLSDSTRAIKQLEDAGISAADQLLIKATADADGNGSISDTEYRQALWSSTLEQWEQNLLLQMRKAQRTQNKDLRKEKMENVVKAQGK